MGPRKGQGSTQRPMQGMKWGELRQVRNRDTREHHRGLNRVLKAKVP